MTANRRDKETVGLARMTSWRRSYSACSFIWYNVCSAAILCGLEKTLCLHMCRFTVKQHVLKIHTEAAGRRFLLKSNCVMCIIHKHNKAQTRSTLIKKQKYSIILYSSAATLNLQTVLLFSRFSAWIVMEFISYKVTSRQNCSDTHLC